MKRMLSRPMGVVLLTAAGALLVAGGIAYATIPDSSGVIHACYQKNVGNLRVIDSSSDTCRPSEVALEWNQTGPTGPAGATGAAGPTGAQGPTGPTGVSEGWWSSQKNLVSIPGNSASTIPLFTTELPAGNYLLSLTAAITSYTAADPGEVQCKVEGADEQVVQLLTEHGIDTEPSLGELNVPSLEQAKVTCKNNTEGPVDIQVYANAIPVATVNN